MCVCVSTHRRDDTILDCNFNVFFLFPLRGSLQVTLRVSRYLFGIPADQIAIAHPTFVHSVMHVWCVGVCVRACVCVYVCVCV